MNRAAWSRIALASAAVATGWVATWSWQGLVAQPYRYVGPALFAALLIGAVGSAVRSTHGRWPLALLAQVVVLVAWFGHREHTGGLLGGWIPTPASIGRLADLIQQGAGQVNKYPAPVAPSHAQAPIYLLAVSVLLILGVDLIAAGLRRAPWAGLPLIVALTVPISVLDSGLSNPVFVLTGVLYAVLLATAEADRLVSWGQAVTGRRQRENDTDQVLEGGSLAGPALKIAGVTAFAAVLLPVLVPLGPGAFNRDDGKGSGPGSAGTITLTNPIADLRRDLVRNDHVPLLDVTTDASAPTYVRLTVLDKFTGDTWEPAPRVLDVANRAVGDLPDPPGIGPDSPGEQSTWRLSTAANFKTTWLPTPYVTRRITIDRGDWRYDSSTLDITSVDDQPPVGVHYSVDALTPTFDPAVLDRASEAQPEVQGPMTQVPGLLPEVTQIAQQVTQAGHSDYAKMVLLQDWFRTDGGFTYSLRQGSGSGMSELLRFITVDKVGYCEQYAAAMAVMARALGIPARVVVGLLAPKKLGPDSYRYTSDDLHAWPEIYFRGSGWVRFEPTPSSRTGTAPAWTTGQVAVAPTTSPTATPTRARPSQAPTSRPTQAPTTTAKHDGSPRWPLVLVGLALVVLLLMAPALLRRAQRARRLRGGANPALTIAALWEELHATAIDLRLSWPEARSVRTIAEALIRWVQPGAVEAAGLHELATLVERARYSREVDLDPEEHARAVARVETWSVLLRDAVRPGQARLARVLPRSVLRRQRDVAPAEPELTLSR